MSATEQVKKKPRVRRNYVNEVKLLEMYLKAAIRLYTSKDLTNDFDKGRLAAYQDVAAFIEGK